MKQWNRNGLALLVGLVAWSTACSEDTPVPAPCVGDACHVDVSGDVDGLSGEDGDADGTADSADTVSVPTLNFALDIKTGLVMTGTTDNVVLTLGDDDKYPAIKGTQVDVVITATGLADGTTVEVDLDGNAQGTAILQGGTATVSQVTIPCAAVKKTLTVRVTNASLGVQPVNKYEQMDCTNGCKATISPPAPCNHDDLDSGTPGFQYGVKVTTSTQDCDQAWVEVTDASGNKSDTHLVPVTLTAQEATVIITVSSKTENLIAAQAVVIAHVIDSTQPDRPEGISPPTTVTVTTAIPDIKINQPVGPNLTLADDLDKNPANGIGVKISGTASTLTTADQGQIVLKINGAVVANTTLQVDDTFVFDYSFSQSGVYTVEVSATNACGLLGAISKPLNVVATTASLTLKSPQAGQLLLAKGDLDPLTTGVYDTQFLIDISGGSIGSSASIYCKKAGPTSVYSNPPVGVALVTDVTATNLPVNVTLDTDLYGTDVVCMVKDDALNPASSGETAFVIALPAPCLNWVEPAADVTVTNSQVSVAFVAKNLNGKEVFATVTAADGSSAPPIDLGAVTADGLQGILSLPPVDGVYAIALESTDIWGNLASQSQCSKVLRTITRDTQGPVMQITLPSKPTLTTLDDPDVAPDQPGFQTDVVVTFTDAAKICLTVDGAALGCQVPLAGATTATFAAVTLQPGNNTFVVSGNDAPGNVVTNDPVSVQLVSDKPSVVFVSPSASLTTAADSQSFVAKVLDSSGNPVTGAVTEVLINGGQPLVPVPVTDNGDGTYSFVVTNLSQSASTSVQFGAAAVGSADKKGYSAPLVLTFKSTKPQIIVTSPQDGSEINLNTAACLVGKEDCSLAVTADAPNVEDGISAKLTVNCGQGPTTYTATVAGQKVKFDAVLLADQSTCTLAGDVIDLAGQEATSTVVTVQVDRIAPVFGAFIIPIKPEPIVLLASDDLLPAVDGMQVLFQVQVSGEPVGAKVQCDAYDDNGKKTGMFQAKSVASTKDGVFGEADFGVIALPDGFKVKLTCTTADLAGNIGAKTFVMEVLSAVPDVRIVQPSPLLVQACVTTADCGGAGICHLGKCFAPWNKLSNKSISLATFGLPNGSLVRICSDGPTVSGPACATAGYKQIGPTADAGTGTVSANAATISLDGVPDGAYHIIAEGSYLPKIAWTSSLASVIATAQDRNVYIDTVAPSVANVVSPTAAVAKAGCLSDKTQDLPDLGAPGGQFTFTATLSEDGQVVMKNNLVKIATVGTTNNIAKVPLGFAVEGAIALTAVPVDVVGNLGPEFVLAPLTVNTVSPSGKFIQPSKPKLLVGDSLDVKITCGDADVENQPVVLQDTGTPLNATQPFVAGTVTFAQADTSALSDGTHALTAALVDECGNGATIGTKPASILVDTKAPVLAFVTPATPAQGVTLTDAQDASADGGYQVTAMFTTSDAASYLLDLGYECDDNFANCGSYQSIKSGPVAVPGGQEPAVLVTIPFGTSTAYSLRLTATDANGNTSVISRGFRVVLSDCTVQLKGLPGATLNTQSCAVKGQNCASVDVQISAFFIGPCGAIDEVQFFKAGAKIASAAPVNGSSSQTYTVKDGESYTIESAVFIGGLAKKSSGVQSVKADLSNPVVQFVAGTVLGQPTYASDTPILLGKPKDLDKNSPDHQYHAQLLVSDAGLPGGSISKLQRTVGAAVSDLSVVSPKIPLALATTSTTVDLQFATLAADATNVVSVTVADAAGNTASASQTIVVDWTAPSALVISDFTPADLKARRPSAKLNFAATGDNNGVGQATAYDVRYSKKAIVTDADFDAACTVTDLAATTVGKPLAAGQADAVTVTGPDIRDPNNPCKFMPLTDNGLSKYYFAVKVSDAAGNVSALSNVVSTAQLRLNYAKIIPSGAYDFLELRVRVFPLGDLNGDGLQDIGIGGNGVIPFCVVYGRPGDANGNVTDMAINAASSSAHICLTNSGGLGATVANANDVNGDGITDLVIGAGTGAGVTREVRVYLGVKGGLISTTPAAKITGIDSITATGPRKVRTLTNFNGDTSAAGLPVGDIVFTVAKGAVVTYERVMVVPGNTNWKTSSPVTIDITSATDRANNNIATIHLIDQVGTPGFGFNLEDGGQVLLENGGVGTQYGELLIAQTVSPQSVVVLHGRAISGDTDIPLTSQTTGVASGDATAVRLYQASGVTGPNSFGTSLSTAEFDGKAGNDLAIGHQTLVSQGGLYWVRASSLAGQEGKMLYVSPGAAVANQANVNTLGVYGYEAPVWASTSISAGNFFAGNGSPHTDLVLNRPYYAPGGATYLTVRGAFTQTTLAGEIGFVWDDLQIADPFVPGNALFGSATIFTSAAIPVGDFNGDGLPDILVGSGDTNGVHGSTLIVY